MSWQTPENSYIVGIFANFATLTEFRNNVGKKQSFDSPGWGPAGPPMGPAPAKPTLEALEELDEEGTLAGVVGVGTPPRQTTAVKAGMGNAFSTCDAAGATT